MRLPRRTLPTCALAVGVLTASLAAPALAQPVGTQPGGTASSASGYAYGLPLGATNLPETRQTRTLAPGVTLTQIVRGKHDPNLFWTSEVTIPPNSSDPDAQGAAVTDRKDAQATADKLQAAGLPARVEAVTAPRTADYGGLLGYRVRVGHFADQTGADAENAQVKAAGYTSASTFTGFDDDAKATPARGPWRVQVLTVDPKVFRGRLTNSYGQDLATRETTASMATGAVAAVNAGFFVFNTKAFAPGDPTGVGVYDGKLERNPNEGRPALEFDSRGRGTDVQRLYWRGSVSGGGRSLRLDGLNRPAGVIQDCGGGTDDVPTGKPLQGTTCTDADEVIAFDTAYGKSLPTGPGTQLDLDARGRVVAVHNTLGGSVPRNGRVLQAIGSDAAALDRLARAGKLVVTSTLVDAKGHRVNYSKQTSIANGGPLLVRNGQLDVTPAQDGFGDAQHVNLYYGFTYKRNPRTVAGVDAHGRLLLVTADGRSVNSLGLSITESGRVAKALGMVQALNFDGGGSTTMVVRGKVINHPSDSSGQRTVGDAVVIRA